MKPQQILLPAVRVTYNYTINTLTATSEGKSTCCRALSTDLECEALNLAESLVGRKLSVEVSNDDNFLFR